MAAPVSIRTPFPTSVIGKIEEANKLKAEGNEKFKAGDVKGASLCYKKIFAFINGLSKDNQYDKYRNTTDAPSASDEEEKAIQELKIAAHSNLALTSFKLGKPDQALKHANEALKLDPVHAKALFKKAQALAELNDYDGALVILTTLKEKNPDDKLIDRELHAVRQKRQVFVKKEQRRYASMFA